MYARQLHSHETILSPGNTTRVKARRYVHHDFGNSTGLNARLVRESHPEAGGPYRNSLSTLINNRWELPVDYAPGPDADKECTLFNRRFNKIGSDKKEYKADKNMERTGMLPLSATAVESSDVDTGAA